MNVSCCTSVSLGRVADHHYRNVNTSGGNEALSQSMHGGAATRVTLDGLADMLWGDALPSNWKQALRNVIAKVRVRLDTIGGGGDAVIVTTPTG